MTAANQTEAERWSGDMATLWIALESANERLFQPVTRALLDAADFRPGVSVVDIGCGNGGSTIAAARRVEGGAVAGIDVSAPMLDRARARSAEEGLGDISYIHADAQTFAGWPDPPFARMISRFGMMFFSDTVAAFRNIARGLVSGAPMTFVAWSAPAANPWFAVPARIVAERFGPQPPADPKAAGPFAFADAPRVLAMMEEAGLRDPEVDVIDVDLCTGAPPADAAPYAAIGPIGLAMREPDRTEDDRRALTDAFVRALDDFATPEGVVVPGRFNLFRARAS